MSLKFHHQNFVSSRYSNPWISVKPIRKHLYDGRIIGLDYLFNRCYTRKKCRRRLFSPDEGKVSLSCKLPDSRKQSTYARKSRRMHCLLASASADDGITVNGNPQASTSSDVEEMRYKLNQSLQSEDNSTGLVQLLYDAARVFELSIKEQSTLSKISWFSTGWLGVDKMAWVKALSYQASAYSLLQAAIEVSSRGERRERDINVFVQKSLSRQSAPLECVIRESLLAKQPEGCEWFWSEQIPAAVTSFINYFENDKQFAAATAVYRKGLPSLSSHSSDVSLLMLALSCVAAITKLGPTKVSCAQFFAIIPDTMARLMDMLAEFIPMHQAYNFIKEIGLRRDFLVHFGPQAAACRVKNDLGTDEIVFWVGLVQKQLQRAIDRERIWSRLTTSESIKVLEKDLAIFGFFIALGRRTQSFLSANGFDGVDEPIEGFIRYLIGGSVLYYPQLSSISSYQLYVEVVCEELDWLPFYPDNSNTQKRTLGQSNKQDVPPNKEAIPLVLDVCSHWIQSFIKYSKWLENPSSVKAARFLSNGHNKLKKCMEELGIQKISSGSYSPTLNESDSFDKALESVEEALLRLEELLQELHVSSSNSGKEHLKAACSDLERIRKLKKEAEFLAASFRAKADCLRQGDDASISSSSITQEQNYSRDKAGEIADTEIDKRRSNPGGLWGFLIWRSSNSADAAPANTSKNDDGSIEQEPVSKGIEDSDSSDIRRFELLRSELIELEKRVQSSAQQCEPEEDEEQIKDDTSRLRNEVKGNPLIRVQKKESIIGKSLDKLKETSTDVLQGTQLLAIDVAAAVGLLRRVLIGDELTQKEKQALQRTLTDLASVVPIGVLMLLPVTAVGHAAMLAAIQRYVPGLIPSTYGPERLDLLRQLEKVKEMEGELNPSEDPEE